MESVDPFYAKPYVHPARGGIIGVVDLVDVVTDSTSDWAMGGHYHWVLDNARQLPFRACKGQLGLFSV
jgi:hypothetical protein